MGIDTVFICLRLPSMPMTLAQMKSKLEDKWEVIRKKWLAIWNHDSLRGMKDFGHFCQNFMRSFFHNRCPTRAAALAFTTILALIPILAVAISVTASLLKDVDEAGIERFIDSMIEKVAPQVDLAEQQFNYFADQPQQEYTIADEAELRKTIVAKKISETIQGIRTGSVSAASMIVLLFIALSLLRTIESTFNDIWGVSRNRKLVTSMVYYWTFMTLGPTMVISAFGLRAAVQIKTVESWIHALPIIGNLVFYFLPVIILSSALVVLYFFMPNTRVSWSSALAGGLASGILLHYNSVFNAKIYKSQVINYTNIYGGLASIPLFLVGLYVSWLIVLLGAQLAYAVQNYQTFWKVHEIEGSRLKKIEYCGLRIMAEIAQSFMAGRKPNTIFYLARRQRIPTELTRQILERLSNAGFITESSNHGSSFCLLKPPSKITIYEIIECLRGGFNEASTQPLHKQSSDVIHEKWNAIMSAERREAEATNLEELVLAWHPQLVKSKNLTPSTDVEIFKTPNSKIDKPKKIASQ